MTTAEQIKEKFKARQARSEHPDGKFDSAGRWYPSDEERQSCCDFVRSPSRAYPYSLMVHCRSKKHIANLFASQEKSMRGE